MNFFSSFPRHGYICVYKNRGNCETYIQENKIICPEEGVTIHKGASIKYVHKSLGFFDPPPLYELAADSTKFTQPPLFRTLFHDPPTDVYILYAFLNNPSVAPCVGIRLIVNAL